MGLTERLLPGPVALDTAIFIYFLESHPIYSPFLRPLFRSIHAGEFLAVTSPIALLEVLVLPYRQGRLALAGQYEAILRRGRNLTLAELTPETGKLAAYLRAHHGVKTPDALHLATALEHGCSAFLTNDRRLPTSLGLEVVQLRDFLRVDEVMEPPRPRYG